MCGIIGGNKYKSVDKVKDGLKSIVNRGIDDNTIFSFDDKMYISHNRLSMQDISENENQPMVSDDSRYYLENFNGELWKSSFVKFDKKLRKKYNFRTEKVIQELLLYYLIDNIKNLESSLRELDGMFEHFGIRR